MYFKLLIRKNKMESRFVTEKNLEKPVLKLWFRNYVPAVYI